MRVTASTFPNTLVDQLERLILRQNRLQSQAATGQRVRLPEDDPAAMRRVLDFQAQSSTLGQYTRNVDQLLDLSNTSYAAMRSLKKVSDRAGEIAVLADGTKAPSELLLYAGEVSQLLQQAVAAANGKFHNDYLYAGTRSDQPPFAITVDADGYVTSVAYSGNASVSQNEIGEDALISAQTLGANTGGSGPRGLITDSRSGADFFNHLISLQNNLRAGNSDAIASTDRVQLAADEDNFLYHFGSIGAVMERLETAKALHAQQTESIESAVSKEVDADLAQTLVRLNETQVAYQAALQSGARVLGQSLLDFIR